MSDPPRNRLRDLLEEHDLLLADIAALCRVDQSTVSRWRDGTIPRRHIANIADYFNVSVPFLDGWSDVRNPRKTKPKEPA